jgi:hypothetical protein
MFVNQKIGTLPQRVGTVEGKVTTLEGQMLDAENKLDTLGTASAKNSTSVVTESSDLVESGAVKDIVGWGNKNILAGMEFGTINQSTGENQNDPYNATKRSINKIKVERGSTVTISGFSSASGKVVRLFYFSESGYLRTELSDSFATTYLTLTIPNDVDYFRYQVAVASLATDYQVEVGPTATAYEPYHASVEESLAQKADNSVIGTVEDGTNPTKSYAVGEHFIRGGKFCTCIVPVTTASTWSDSYYVVGAVGDVIYRQYAKANITVASNSFESIEIPTIDDYVPYLITVSVNGAGFANYGNTEVAWDGYPKYIRLQNKDGESRTWTAYINCVYVKANSLTRIIIN